ncbi:MAG TPA: hypothetical protein VGL11_11080 [Candidatus Binatia bacterium]
MWQKPIDLGRSRVARFLVFLFLSVPFYSCSSTEPFRPPQKVEEAFARGDAQGVLNGYDAAVAADPDNVQLRMARCGFLAEMLELSRDQRDLIRKRALSDCEYVLKTAREGRLVAHANDLIRMIEQRRVFAEKSYPCPADARKASTLAYTLARAHKLKESLPHYKRALDGCPENAALWIQYGHTYILLRDFQQAKVFLSEGVKREPWERSGHLFLSDLYRDTGQPELAFKHAALAVVSDPSNEFAWEQLRERASARGRGWRRAVNRRPVVQLDSRGESQVSLPAGTDLNSPETNFWLGLGLVEASELKQAAKQPGGARDNRSALVKDRERVRENLDFQHHQIAKDPSKRSRITDLMEEAAAAGYLDEAIFLCLVDARLAPEYVAYREKNGERLLDYIAKILAPPRSGRP